MAHNPLECMVCETKRPGRRSVQCDKCDRWSHYSCVGLSREQVDQMINYFCDNCRSDRFMITWRRVTATQKQRVMKAKHYYDVVRIAGHRGTPGDGNREFLVEWDWPAPGSRPSSVRNVRTWEPEAHLDGCIDLLQHYCLSVNLTLSKIVGLMGADSSTGGHNESNWISMATLLGQFEQVRVRKKLPLSLLALEWNGFIKQDALYFLRHDQHCYVLLHIVNRQLAFIADGGNVFRTNLKVANEIKQLLGIRLVSLSFDQQLAIDHCGSSAILIGVELLKMHCRKSRFQELVASKSLRTELVTALHKESSQPTTKPPLGQRRKVLDCPHCNRKFKSTQGRNLNTHLRNVHKIVTGTATK